jgi:hypothetical protein
VGVSRSRCLIPEVGCYVDVGASEGMAARISTSVRAVALGPIRECISVLLKTHYKLSRFLATRSFL